MGDWCASWSSKPVWGVKSVPGGFDSHMPSPKKAVLCGFLAVKKLTEVL